MKQYASALRAVFQAVYDVVDLINATAVPCGPGAPLRTIERAQIAVLSRPFIPDADAVFTEPLGVGIATQKPNQFIDDTFKVNALGRENRKSLLQIKPELSTEHRSGASASSVTAVNAGFTNIAQ